MKHSNCCFSLVFNLSLASVLFGGDLIESNRDIIGSSNAWGKKAEEGGTALGALSDLVSNSSALVWGEISEGFQMSAHSLAKSYFVSDPIALTIIIKNVSEKDLTWIESDPQYDFNILVTDAQGNEIVPRMQINSDIGLRVTLKRMNVIIPPGNAIRYQFDIQKYYLFKKPGEFIATVSANVRKLCSDKTMPLRSNRISFSIRTPKDSP